ncbi:MAG: ABC transporter substrate-binding protein, partial [Alphaproteobacteria bacterium]
MKRLTAMSAIFGATVLAGATALTPAANAQKMYDGVEINLLTRPGPVIAGRLAERGLEYEEMTGAKITVATVPFADLFQKLLTDWATGTNSIDVGVFASGWAVELEAGGLLADLSDFVANDDKIDLDDIAPFFRDFNQKINGKTHLITIDGDFQMVYYRTDVLADLGLEPPRTWDEYIEVAAAAHGRDMNGDGEADFGSCMFKKRNAQSYFAILSVAGGYLQTQGTSEGIFFDTDDMTPLINNEAFGEALRVYKA